MDAAGASVPAWSADGKSLLYVAQDAVWLLPRLNGQSVRIAGPLFPPGHWPLSYYGQLGWSGQFAWWSGNMPVRPAQVSAKPTAARSAPGARLARSGIGRVASAARATSASGVGYASLGPPTRPYHVGGPGCGIDHYIKWPGLQAYFGQGRFVGYSYQGAELRTAAGLHAGDSIRHASQLYGKALQLSLEQGGAWSPARRSGRSMASPTDAQATQPTLAPTAGSRQSKLAQSVARASVHDLITVAGAPLAGLRSLRPASEHTEQPARRGRKLH